MKILIAVLAVIVVVYQFVVRPMVTNPLSADAVTRLATYTRVNWAVDPVALRKHVDALTGISPHRNIAHPESLDKAAAYIRADFESRGLQVREQVYEVDGAKYRNIIAEVGPPSGELIVVGAHYDVCEDQPGADDNASGVAGLLELSRLLVAAENMNKRVQLVAYTLEEPPAYDTENMGSLVHAKSLKEAGLQVKLMLSLEMIGYFSDKPGSQTFPIALMKLDYPSVGNFISIVANTRYRAETARLKELMLKHSSIPVFSINSPELVPGIDYSDHRSYWEMGYPALMVTDTAFYRNFNYHKPTDTPDTLDYDRMAEVVKGVYGAVVEWN